MLSLQLGSPNWTFMTRSHGAVWETSRVPAGPLQFRFIVTAGYDGKWIWAKQSVLPADWRPGSVYDSGVQIHDIAQEGCPHCDDGNWKWRVNVNTVKIAPVQYQFFLPKQTPYHHGSVGKIGNFSNVIQLLWDQHDFLPNQWSVTTREQTQVESCRWLLFHPSMAVISLFFGCNFKSSRSFYRDEPCFSFLSTCIERTPIFLHWL